MKRVLFASLAAAIVCVTASAGVRAQSAAAASPQRNWYSVTLTTVKAERVAEWLEIQKSQTIPMLKKGNVLGTAVSRTVFGGNGNEYHLVTYLGNFAEIDKGPAQVQVLGQAAATALAAKGTPHIANVERTILRYVPDLSYRPKPV